MFKSRRPEGISCSEFRVSRSEYSGSAHETRETRNDHVEACQSHQNENLATPLLLKCRSRAFRWTALACSNDNHFPGVPSPQGPLLSLGNW